MICIFVSLKNFFIQYMCIFQIDFEIGYQLRYIMLEKDIIFQYRIFKVIKYGIFLNYCVWVDNNYYLINKIIILIQGYKLDEELVRVDEN